MTEIILTIICAVIPIIWIYINKKLDKLFAGQDLNYEIYISSVKELQELYEITMIFIKDKAKDGIITEAEKIEIIEFVKAEAKKRGINLIKYLTPKVYLYILDKMLEKKKNDR